MADAAKAVRPDVLVLCHGGPDRRARRRGLRSSRRPEGIAGFFGASSIERLPTEPAIVGQVKAFTGLRLGESN